MKTHTRTTCRPRHAIPGLQSTPLSIRSRSHGSFLGFGILGFGIFLGFGILGFGIFSPLLAQQLPQPELAQLTTTGTITPATPAAPAVPVTTPPSTSGRGAGGEGLPQANDEVVHMDVFTVDAAKNEDGYSVFNTTSGSRINTPLRDTAASISPFSEEFLNDIGAATLDDILNYVGNMEIDTNDTIGANNNYSLGANSINTNFRIRGIGGGISMDSVDSSIPIDMYNAGTVELSSGANSILFGLGPQGGMLTLSTKRANLQRNSTKVQGVIGTWAGPVNGIPYKRLTLDYNVVLMPKKWAFRLMGVIQDGSDGSWRYGIAFNQKRLTPVMAIKPWKNTTLHLVYEKGTIKQTAARSTVGLSDGITGWLYWRDQQAAAGIPNPGILQGFGSAYAPPAYPMTDPFGTAYTMNPATQINSGGGNPYYVYVNNNDTFYDYRQAYVSANIYSGNPNTIPLGTNLDDRIFLYNPTGPNAWKMNRFDRRSLTLEQRIGAFNFQFAYNHNKIATNTHSPTNMNFNSNILRADPNTQVSPYLWGGSAPENLVPGPNPGGLYIEDIWMISDNTETNNTYRLITETSLNLKKYGRHRIVALLERADQERIGGNKEEILVDQNQVAITNSLNTNTSSNYVYRRHYVTPGDYRTYHCGNWEPAITDLVINTPTGLRTFHSQYVAYGLQSAHVTRNTTTAGLTLQSYWFHDKLVTTFGGRYDNYDYGQELTNRVTDPNDPRILNKTKVFNEWAFNGLWNKRRYEALTYSAGGVWHITNWLSGFVNYSSNRGAPYLDGRTVLPDGASPNLSRGTTTDFGIRLYLTRNGKWTLNLSHYDTRQLGQAAIIPDGLTHDISGTLGGNALFNIFDALYFLHPTGQTGMAPANGWLAGTGIVPGTVNEGYGPMSAGQYAILPPDPGRYPYGTPPKYNSGTVNVRSEGYELELNAQPTRNIELRFLFSYTRRDRNSIFPEIFDYYNKNIPIWLDLANPVTHPNPNSTDGSAQYLVDGVTPLRDYIRAQLWGADGTGGIRNGLNNQLYAQSGPMGSRPYKFNLTGKYKFQEGFLKGFQAGGSVRYASPYLMPDPTSVGIKQAFTMPPDETMDIALDPQLYYRKRGMLKGNSLTFFDVFFIYRCKILGGRANMTLQLNIRNLFNQDIITKSRINVNYQVTNVNISPPRTLRLTTTFDF